MVTLTLPKLSPITDNIAIIMKILSIMAIKKFVPIIATILAIPTIPRYRKENFIYLLSKFITKQTKREYCVVCTLINFFI